MRRVPPSSSRRSRPAPRAASSATREKRARARAHAAERTTGIAVALLGSATGRYTRDDVPPHTRPVSRPAPGAVRGRRRAPARDQRLRPPHPLGDQGRDRRPRGRRAGPARRGRRSPRGALLVVALALRPGDRPDGVAPGPARGRVSGRGRDPSRPVRRLPASRAGVLPGPPHRGPHVAGHERPAERVDARRIRPPVPGEHGDRLRGDPRSRCSASTPGSPWRRWRRTRSWWRWPAATTRARTPRRWPSRSSWRAWPTRPRRT